MIWQCYHKTGDGSSCILPCDSSAVVQLSSHLLLDSRHSRRPYNNILSPVIPPIHETLCSCFCWTINSRNITSQHKYMHNTELTLNKIKNIFEYHLDLTRITLNLKENKITVQVRFLLNNRTLRAAQFNLTKSKIFLLEISPKSTWIGRAIIVYLPSYPSICIFIAVSVCISIQEGWRKQKNSLFTLTSIATTEN